VNETFNVHRLWLLIRSDAIGDYRAVLVTSAALAALMLLVSMLGIAQGEGNPNFYRGTYFGMLFLIGPIVASFSFRELHDKTKNEAYLLTPASSLEKTVVRLFRATIVFYLFTLVFLTLTSVVIEGVNWLVFGRHNPLFNASRELAWVPVGHFLVSVSLYFLGAAWFRRWHFIKTALTLTIIPVALMTLTGIIARLVLGEGFFEGSVDVSGDDFRDYYMANQSMFDALLGVCKFVYFFAVPLFCWCVAWLRVKEAQVSHGV
jgi:hypothetical protein